MSDKCSYKTTGNVDREMTRVRVRVWILVLPGLRGSASPEYCQDRLKMSYTDVILVGIVSFV